MCYLATNPIRSRYVGTNNKRRYLGAYRVGQGTTKPNANAYLTDKCAKLGYFGGNRKTWYLAANCAKLWYLRDACSRWYLTVKCARLWHNAVKHRGVRKRP